MPVLKLITEVIPKKTEVIVTHPQSYLGAEILRQISDYSYIEPVPLTNLENFPQADNLGVVIHLAGFDAPSLSHTLSYTSSLHQLLVFTRSHQAKFVLVVPNSHNHLYHTAIALVTQFAKTHTLQYLVLEIDKSSPPTEIASEIVKKFIYSHQRPKRSDSSVFISPPPTKKYVKQINISLFIKIMLVTLVVPYITFAMGLVLSIVLLYCTASKTQSLSLSQALTCSHYSTNVFTWLSYQSKFTPFTTSVMKSIGLPLLEVTSTTHSLTDSLKILAKTQVRGREVVKNLYFVDNPNATSSDTADLMAHISSSAESVATLQTQLRSMYLASTRPLSVFNNLALFASKAHQTLSHLVIVSDQLNTLLGIDKKNQTLIVIQDNTEQKPSGGYLDSLILLTSEKGKVTQIQLTTSQSADNQLVGTVSSPPDFQAVTNRGQWYLRDSNWDPDFPTTARRIAWFIEKELSFKPDVVISLNLTTLQLLLDVTGPLKLDGSVKKINSQNLIPEYLNFLKNSPQADSMLYRLFNVIVDKSKTFSDKQIDKLIAGTLQLIEKHQVLIYPTSSSVAAITSVGWSGGVNLPTCRSTFNCFVDYYSAFDTNIAENKTDQFILRKTEINTEITSKNIYTIHSLQYENTSSENLWPQGNHNNYLRILVPSSSTIEEVRLNNETLFPHEYFVSQLSNLTQIGLLVNTSPKSISSVQLKISRPLLSQERFHYQLDIQNQPGSSSSPLKVGVTYPKSWFATSYTQTSVASPGSLQYNTQIDRPFNVDIDLTPND